MKTKKAQPKKKFNGKRLFVAMAIIVIGLGLLVLKENRRHRLVNESINQLQASLKNSGFNNIEKSSGCGRTQVKYGAGAKVCTITLKDSIGFNTGKTIYRNEAILATVNDKVSVFYATIESTKSYTRQGEKPVIHAPRKGFDFGSVSYSHVGSGSGCSGNVDFSWDSLVLEVSFYCRDTSWFTRTFQNGKFSF